MSEPKECCLEFGEDLNREINRQDALIRRAAELLRPERLYEDQPGKWDKDRDQWLRDAGVEK